jgi:phosphoribosyl 1,2-cyclic phosphodiesterase
MAMNFSPLFSGSSGNATLVSGGGTNILVDAGVNGKNIDYALNALKFDPSKLDAILITHEHSDHVIGAGVISRRYNIPIYANRSTWNAFGNKIGSIALDHQREFFDSFYIKEMLVEPYSIPHDAADPVCYSLSTGSSKISIATDLGHFTKRLLAKFENSDVVLLESNHDIDMLNRGPYPPYLKKRILGTKGHLSNEMAASAAYELARLGVRGIMLAHLSEKNNTESIAYKTVSDYLDQKGVVIGKHMALSVLEKRCKPFLYQVGAK